MAARMHVPRLTVPEPANGVEALVCALALVWNRQAKDPMARLFFGPSTAAERQDMVMTAIYRFPDERDRALLARLLKELADALYGATYPWTA
jgi:hypothetical protein